MAERKKSENMKKSRKEVNIERDNIGRKMKDKIRKIRRRRKSETYMA